MYYYNCKYKRNGHLFQDRFKSEPIEDDSHLLAVLRYIYNNLVRAGLSRSANKYQWSSYNEYLQSNNLVDVEFVLGMMDRDEFINFHSQQDDEIWVFSYTCQASCLIKYEEDMYDKVKKGH